MGKTFSGNLSDGMKYLTENTLEPITREGAKFHHSATIKGYVSRKKEFEVFTYNGRFGKGFAVIHANRKSSLFADIDYYIIGKDKVQENEKGGQNTMKKALNTKDMFKAKREADTINKEMEKVRTMLYNAKFKGNRVTAKTIESDLLEPINERYRENEAKIRNIEKKFFDAITVAEGKATVRTITPYMIYKALVEVERRLDIPKTSLEGVSVVIDCNAQDFPKAYKYIPYSTFFDAIFEKGSWKITSIYREKTATEGHGYKINLTETAKEKILEKVSEF